MLNRIYTSLICGALGAVAAFFLTHSYYTEKIQRIYAEIEAGTRAEEVKAIDQQRHDEAYFQTMQNTEEGQALDAYAAIHFKFDSISSTSTDRMQLQNSDDSNSPALSNTAGAASTAPAACDCRRIRQTYNNLKQQCGLLAKERDELAVDRNELIKLYNQVRAHYGNEIKDRVQKDR